MIRKDGPRCPAPGLLDLCAQAADYGCVSNRGGRSNDSYLSISGPAVTDEGTAELQAAINPAGNDE